MSIHKTRQENASKRLLGKCFALDNCRSRASRWLLLVLIAALPVCPSIVLAQSGGNPATPDHGGSGAQLFREYCAQCHGTDGTGNGPVASELKRKPVNLTTLSKNDNGVFPTSQVLYYRNSDSCIPWHAGNACLGIRVHFPTGCNGRTLRADRHTSTGRRQGQSARRLSKIDPTKLTRN
jgi:Cytochrome c